MDSKRIPDSIRFLAAFLFTVTILSAVPSPAVTFDAAGGDDVIVDQILGPADNAMAIAENGDIYVAIEHFFAVGGMQIQVYRSLDGGDSFQLWGELSNVFHEITFHDPSIVVAGGTCYVAYRRTNSGTPDSIFLSAAPTADATASWRPALEILAGDGTTWYSDPQLVSDADNYQAFNLYLTAKSSRDSSERVWFARSTTAGDSFEAPYALAKYDDSSGNLSAPRIATGFGGVVHVAWTFFTSDPGHDNTTSYRRCPGRGAGGVTAWDPEVVLASGGNGISEFGPVLAAAPFADDVQVCFLRYQWDASSLTYTPLGLGAGHSPDGGVTWDPEADIALALDGLDGMIWAAYDRFVVTGWVGSAPAFQVADADDPWSWDEPSSFADTAPVSSLIPPTSVAADPSHDWRMAQVWSHNDGDIIAGETDPLFFDAEWRNDPGYPNLMPGFPVTLDVAPLCDPTVADLDADGRMEIVFTDEANRICVYRHDGTPYPGWPLSTGVPLARGPVAIGDLNGDGVPTIFAGTADGRILGFTVPYGVYHPYPVTLSPADSVFVSIGALGGPYPRTLIATVGYKLVFLDYKGGTPPGAHGWIFSGDDLHQPAASGDIDGDGVADVLVAGNTTVTALDLKATATRWVRDLGRTISGAPTLGDMDLDGDMEVVIPTADGWIFVLDDMGNDISGFPVDTGAASTLSSVALANLTGSPEPELVATCHDGRIYAYDHTGAPLSGYPAAADAGFPLQAMPVVMKVDNGAFSPLAGSDAGNIWAWDVLGAVKDHFPYALDGGVSLAAACGDLLGVSRIQAVFLTHDNPGLVALDFGSSSTYALWPMAAHDPRNTGCYGCVEDVATGVDDGGGAATSRVSFAAPAPNPSAGSTLFSFSLPVRAAARLDVFDVRGMRVRTVLKEELAAGLHTVSWDGRDDRGQRPASGVYYARLRLRGPGIDQELTRKIVRLR